MAHGGIVARQQQSPAMSPEHLMGKAVLKMNLQEAQQYVEMQFAENPALVMEEESRCPACGCVLTGDFCPACGSEKVSIDDSILPDNDDWEETTWSSSTGGQDDYYEPFAVVANPLTLEEHLKQQIRLNIPEENQAIAENIVECLDEDGYLRESLVDISSRFGLSVPQLETVLAQVQTLDPSGVGARDLRECLLLQLGQLEYRSDNFEIAEILVRDHWDGLSHLKLDKVATLLKVDRQDIVDALHFIKENTNPHPANGFRDPWAKLSPRSVSRTHPDVIISASEEGLTARVPDPVTGRVGVEDTYAILYSEISQKKGGFSDKDKTHIKECVNQAKALIDALEFRKSTLRRIVEELMRVQADFLIEGPLALKPMTKKELAEKIGVHESTVCRATQDKTIRLPSGEVIDFDVLFDAALPVKEMVRALAVERLSDSEIARRLSESGVQVARRTVAKYRDQLKVLPLEYRLG